MSLGWEGINYNIGTATAGGTFGTTDVVIDYTPTPATTGGNLGGVWMNGRKIGYITGWSQRREVSPYYSTYDNSWGARYYEPSPAIYHELQFVSFPEARIDDKGESKIFEAMTKLVSSESAPSIGKEIAAKPQKKNEWEDDLELV